MKGKRPEILAPAGDFTCLQAALDAGADAVYFGLGTFNMRARSGVNFCEADLPEVAARCRAAGVKAYLTLNAIMFEDEAEEIDRIVHRLRLGRHINLPPPRRGVPRLHPDVHVQLRRRRIPRVAGRVARRSREGVYA